MNKLATMLRGVGAPGALKRPAVRASGERSLPVPPERALLNLRCRFRPTGDPGELATDPVHRRHLAELHLAKGRVKAWAAFSDSDACVP